jgi:hypothetical protein
MKALFLKEIEQKKVFVIVLLDLVNLKKSEKLTRLHEIDLLMKLTTNRHA